MFAVVKTGGKQYRVENNSLLKIEKIEGSVGDTVVLGEVLMVSENGNLTVDAHQLSKAQVEAKIIAQTRNPKIIIFKKKRRHNYRRKNGHRQHVTIVRISKISA